MKLQEIFDTLTDSELSLLSMGGQEQGVINKENYPTMVRHVNLALTTLFRRFNLREGRLTLKLDPEIDTYSLTSRNAVTKWGKLNPRYILDSESNPFKDDLQKVEIVLTDKDEELVLNDRSNPLSVLTLSTTELYVPKEIREKYETLGIVYRASHPKIRIYEGEDFDPHYVEIGLPYNFLNALVLFIASRVHTPKGLGEYEVAMGNAWFARYEAECQRLELENLQIDRNTANLRLDKGGWV